MSDQEVAIYGALYRFTMSINGMDLRCMDPWLNICRVGFKSPRLELEIFTPLLTVNAPHHTNLHTETWRADASCDERTQQLVALVLAAPDRIVVRPTTVLAVFALP